MIGRFSRPAVGSLFVVEPAWHRSIAVFVAASAASATTPATASPAASVRLIVVAGAARGGPGIAAVTRLRVSSLANGPGRGSRFGTRRDERLVRVVTLRPRGLAILTRGRLGRRPATAEREFVLVAIAPAGRRFH